jgi:hypothetical protein
VVVSQHKTNKGLQKVSMMIPAEGPQHPPQPLQKPCHRDMRDLTCGTMTLGKGVMYSTSTRQKLNTRSSMEAEVVAVMGQVLWTQFCLMAQGLYVDNNVVYQDNQSTILWGNNGIGSSGKCA